MGMLVKRPVRVTVIVTERFKQRRSEEIRTALARLDLVARRIDSQLGRQEPLEERVAERLRAEKRRNERATLALRRELETVVGLEVGSRHGRGTVEGLVEIEIGDDLSRINACEIVVEDNKVVEILDGPCPEPSETS